jgi:hypothetical protein
MIILLLPDELPSTEEPRITFIKNLIYSAPPGNRNPGKELTGLIKSKI